MKLYSSLFALILSSATVSTAAVALDLEEQFGHQIPDARLFTASLKASEALTVQLNLGEGEDEFEEDCEAVDRLMSDSSVATEVVEGLIDETPATLVLRLPVFSSDQGPIWREAFVEADAEAASWIILQESGFVPRILTLQAGFGTPPEESKLPEAQFVAINEFADLLKRIPVGDLAQIYDRGRFTLPIMSPMVSCWLYRERPNMEVLLRGRALQRVVSKWQIPEETVRETLLAVSEALPTAVQETGLRSASELSVLVPVLLTAEVSERYSSILTPAQLIAIIRTGSAWAEKVILLSSLTLDQQSLDQLAQEHFEEKSQTAALVGYSALGALEVIQ